MSQSSSWVPLGAAFLGGLLVLAGNIGLELMRREHDRRSLALAFKGELQAIREIVRVRHYVEVLDGVLDALFIGITTQAEPIRIERNYFPVYTENASRIGILPPRIAQKITSAYTYANSFIEDATAPRPSALRPEMAELVQQTLSVLKLSLSEGASAIELIDDYYPNGLPLWRSKCALLWARFTSRAQSALGRFRHR